MVDTDGELVSMTNREAADAARLFEETEGIDIHPAAAVATASLIQAVNNKSVSPDAVIMLNITGGGEERFKREKGSLDFLKPLLVISPDVTVEELATKLSAL
jgi:cysteate synthase